MRHYGLVMDQVQWLSDREQAAWRGLITMNALLFGRIRRSLVRDVGLSDSDYDVLVNLSEAPAGRLRAFELVAALQWEKSRLSHHLRRMEQRGLIMREDCDTDRRGSVVALTELGTATLEAAAPGHVDEVRRSFIDPLTPVQIDALAEISRAVVAHLRDLDEEASGAVEGPVD